MRLLQYRNPGGDVCVGVVQCDPERIEELAEPTSVRELAGVADESGEHLESVVRARLAGRYAARSDPELLLGELPDDRGHRSAPRARRCRDLVATVQDRRSQHDPQPRQHGAPSRSSTRRSAAPATCIATFSVPPRSALPPASPRRPVTGSKSNRRPSGARCATRTAGGLISVTCLEPLQEVTVSTDRTNRTRWTRAFELFEYLSQVQTQEKLTEAVIAPMVSTGNSVPARHCSRSFGSRQSGGWVWH